MRILAIDPGSERSAWLMTDHDCIPWLHGIETNADLLGMLFDMPQEYGADAIVIEEIASYGMPVGREVFQTVRWSGRFEQVCSPNPVDYLPRLKVKLHLCHSPKANDATIRAALIDRFGGQERAIGRKATPGPLYQIHKDLWAALALAVTFADGER